ncbi:MULTISPECIES: SusC/RagA family TonB-linked outer membrane protein [Butyricimonas]|uniref:SusC/RagA family TonB-linked outer membrane protein n=1 Tax=Butyricimonas TaxID=574697 RepID=UPI0007FB2135|nr:MULTISPECIES: SusC/RagA family TonB-linked outer membrane protein [Butyricimonas]
MEKKLHHKRSVLKKGISLMFLLVSTFLIVPGFAADHEGMQQQVREKRVTINKKDVSVKEILEEIKQQTGFDFVVNAGFIADLGKRTLNVKEVTVDEALLVLLRGTKYAYEIVNNRITFVLKSGEDAVGKVKMVKVKGQVWDEFKKPLPGVTVTLKGTSTGVASDVEGTFEINVNQKDTVVLVFSFVGMKTREIAWRGEEMLNVVLVEDVQAMDEVVVTGYQTLKKSDMAGSSSVVSAKDLMFTATNSLEQALQGKIAGMVIQNTNGLIGTRQKVRVRGTSTLLGSQEPVWVVDGIIQEDPLPFKTEDFKLFGQDNMDNFEMMRNFVGSAISWLNPSDIKDITVLKDASATAIYGVKAANGVIVITTKRGEAGRVSVTYSGNFSIGSKLTYDKMELMNSKERIDVSREIYENGYPALASKIPSVGFSGIMKRYLEDKISYDEFNAGVKKLETMNTDWFDILYENPFSHSHNISLSGGGDKTTYYASFGITGNNGTAKGNDSESYNGRVNVTTIFKEKFHLSGSLSGSVTKTNAFNQIDPYKYASRTSRAIPCYNEDGSLAFYKERNGYDYNILHELSQSGNKNRSTNLNFSLFGGWDILSGLKYELTFSYGTSSTHGETWATELSNAMAEIRGYEFGMYTPEDSQYKKSRLPQGGELSLMESRMETWTVRNSLSYVGHADKHLYTVLIGQEARKTSNEGYNETVWGYIPSRGKSIVTPPVEIEDAYSTNKTANPLFDQMNQKITDNTATYVSYYGTLTYSYDERYIFNASIRGDASNKFGQDKSARFQPVWSVGVRWNLGREHFMEGQRLLNEMSFRASYGFQGNVCEASGPDLIAGIPSDGGVWGPTGEYYLTTSRLPNPRLKWEKNRSVNLGVDFTLLNNHVSGTFEYYYKRGKDIVVRRAVPHANGVTSMYMNGGTMENKGWELTMNFVPLRLDEFVWNLSLNTSKNYNKITSKLEENTTWTNAASGGLSRDGYPVSAFWAFAFDGLSPVDGSPLFDFFDAEENPKVKTDATTYMKYMGKLDPDFTAGLSTSFRYKSLALSASFNLQLGGKKFLAPAFDAGIQNDIPSDYNNLPKELVKRWRKPGDEVYTNIPSLPYADKGRIKAPDGKFLYPHEIYNYCDERVVDAWFLKCNNISLSYTFPEKWIKGFVQSIGLSFSVTNPFQFVSNDFKGRDPEVATGSQPMARNYNLNVSVSF